MTRSLRLPLAVMAAMLIAAMWFASAAQAGAPMASPTPTPRPDAQAAQPAQTVCFARDSVVAKLVKRYGEARRGGGLGGLGGPLAFFEIWASDVTGSWTILKTTPDGLACIIAVGNGWHDDAALTPTGDPA